MRLEVFVSLLCSLFYAISCDECPKGWVRILNKCYFKLPVLVSREENRNFCNEMKAELASVKNEFENRMISAVSGGDSSWTSAVRAGTSNEYRWSGNESLVFTNWAKGEPNKDSQADSCVTMSAGVWKSVPCDSKHFLLCQMNIDSDTGCEDGWLRFEDKCFIVNEANTKVFGNEIHCRKMGATMVTIHTELENAFIDAMTKRDTFYWLGGNREKFGSQKFIWFDGSPFDYTKWDTNAHEPRYGWPDQPNGFPGNEYNLVMFNGYWHDWGGDVEGNLHSHLCQKHVHEMNGDLNTRVDALSMKVKQLKGDVLVIGTLIHDLVKRITPLN